MTCSCDHGWQCRPDQMLAVGLGEAFADDCDGYEITKHTTVGQCIAYLPRQFTTLDIERDGRSFRVIVFERESEK